MKYPIGRGNDLEDISFKKAPACLFYAGFLIWSRLCKSDCEEIYCGAGNIQRLFPEPVSDCRDCGGRILLVSFPAPCDPVSCPARALFYKNEKGRGSSLSYLDGHIGRHTDLYSRAQHGDQGQPSMRCRHPSAVHLLRSRLSHPALVLLFLSEDPMEPAESSIRCSCRFIGHDS